MQDFHPLFIYFVQLQGFHISKDSKVYFSFRKIPEINFGYSILEYVQKDLQ